MWLLQKSLCLRLRERFEAKVCISDSIVISISPVMPELFSWTASTNQATLMSCEKELEKSRMTLGAIIWHQVGKKTCQNLGALKWQKSKVDDMSYRVYGRQDNSLSFLCYWFTSHKPTVYAATRWKSNALSNGMYWFSHFCRKIVMMFFDIDKSING